MSDPTGAERIRNDLRAEDRYDVTAFDEDAWDNRYERRMLG
jgi:hypothetical protein